MAIVGESSWAALREKAMARHSEGEDLGRARLLLCEILSCLGWEPTRLAREAGLQPSTVSRFLRQNEAGSVRGLGFKAATLINAVLIGKDAVEIKRREFLRAVGFGSLLSAVSTDSPMAASVRRPVRASSASRVVVPASLAHESLAALLRQAQDATEKDVLHVRHTTHAWIEELSEDGAAHHELGAQVLAQNYLLHGVSYHEEPADRLGGGIYWLQHAEAVARGAGFNQIAHEAMWRQIEHLRKAADNAWDPKAYTPALNQLDKLLSEDAVPSWIVVGAWGEGAKAAIGRRDDQAYADALVKAQNALEEARQQPTTDAWSDFMTHYVSIMVTDMTMRGYGAFCPSTPEVIGAAERLVDDARRQRANACTEYVTLPYARARVLLKSSEAAQRVQGLLILQRARWEAQSKGFLRQRQSGARIYNTEVRLTGSSDDRTPGFPSRHRGWCARCASETEWQLIISEATLGASYICRGPKRQSPPHMPL